MTEQTQAGSGTATDAAAADEQAVDRVAVLAARYHEAFPSVEPDAFSSHLSVNVTGALQGRIVARYLNNRFGINGARYSLLRALYFAKDKRLQQSEVARVMNVTSPNVTQLIDALEKDGLVERVVNESDRRVTYAELTPEGDAKCAEIVPAMAQFMKQTCDALSTEEKAQLVRLLTKLRGHLAELEAEL